MEEKTQVNTYEVKYKCNKCNEGYMIPSGFVYTTNPPKFQHICDNPNCGNIVTLDKAYPYIEYESQNSREN